MRIPIATLVLLSVATIAHAHENTGAAGGFASGFMHPILGWDHVAAMVAVGLWGAILSQPAIWALPVTFPRVVAVGGALGVAGLALPGVEIGIAASALVLGAAVVFAVRPPLWTAALIVGAFAVFHGHAHGTELPHAVSPLAYSVGFVVSTGLLHLCGIAVGLLANWRAGRVLVRAGGAVIVLAGAFFLLRAV